MFYEHDGSIYNLLTMKRALKVGDYQIKIVYPRDWFSLFFDTTYAREQAYQAIMGRMEALNANVRVV